MARRQKTERVLGLDGKTRAAVGVLLDLTSDLDGYLLFRENAVIVKDYTFAGAGASFLIAALISLWSGRADDAVDLHRITDLDEHNRRAFLAMLEAYLNG